MNTVFIDGQSGTTGLRLRERLRSRSDLSLISLPEAQRKDRASRREAMASADITVLCLPDEAAREATELAQDTGTRLIDTSTAHRTAQDWTYGMPELTATRAGEIACADRVSVPGCHATGFILLTAPLVRSGIIPADERLVATSITGYSGGGKKMIAQYESADRTENDALNAPQPYAFGQTHKHLPEMVAATHLTHAPVFEPIVGNFACGMLVTVALFPSALGISRQNIEDAWLEAYAAMPCVKVLPFEAMLTDGALYAGAAAGCDAIKLSLSGNDDRILLTALYDNLGKGASGTALECLNLMLGVPLTTGLNLEG